MANRQGDQAAGGLAARIEAALVLHRAGDLDAARRAYLAILAAYPRSADAHQLLATLHVQRGELAEGLAAYERALAINPLNAAGLNNYASTLVRIGRHADAVAALDRALGVKGLAAATAATLHVNRGTALKILKRNAEAAVSFRLALNIAPELDFVRGHLWHEKLQTCDWSGIADLEAAIVTRARRGERVILPFEALSIPDPQLQTRIASVWVRATTEPASMPAFPSPRAGERIRIGYVSSEFREHATMYLMAGLLEQHDRARFDVTCFAFGPRIDDAMSRRVADAVDRVVDIRDMSDAEAAAAARRLEIDIALDLKGATADNRFGIFVQRAAPVQVGFLGYPGSMGSSALDYLVADPIVIPPDQAGLYAEKIAWMPTCYQVNDSQRIVSSRVFTRAECGLPETGFVFCCFNAVYKITPAIFDLWMNLLRQVDGSVLWLLDENQWASANLRAEAVARGVAPDRLVFAGRIPAAEHLARLKLADLFLDTAPVNAHTTASDALLVGVPVLTLIGETFASRVAASLVSASGAPDLVADNPAAYEALAAKLARDASMLAAIRSRLSRGGAPPPIYDTARYAREFESLLIRMHERRVRGEAPDHILAG